jgi:acyl-CoA synthetase (AMP-forming)/AMP-acid ligase II
MGPSLSNNMTPKPSTVVDIVRDRAMYQGAQKAYTFLGDRDSEESSLTYGDLDRQARAVGAWLQSSGASGERVLLLLPTGLEYIVAFFGCLYAGAVAVPVYPPRPNEKSQRLQAVATDARANFGITTAMTLSRLESPTPRQQNLRTLRWLVIDRMEEDSCTGWKELSLRGDTPALIQYTSGSTAEPKGVIVSHGNLLENSAIIYRHFGHNPASKGVIWLPPYHDMGLIGGVLQPLYGGFPVTLMSPVSFLLRPLRWLQAISRARATTSGGPNFAYDLCVRKISKDQRSTLDLSSWEVAFNGAEPIRADTLERFTAAFAQCGFRREAFYPCYGLAEATLFVAGKPKESPPVVCKVQPRALQQQRVVAANGKNEASELVASGRRSPNLEVAIVDPSGLTRCPPNRVGEIWVSGASVALGYWNRPAETEATFCAHIADTGEGPFLRTGDLGFFIDGDLVIAGRLKDLIILAGRNHYPQDIELTVEQAHPALRSSCCAAFSVNCDGAERLIVMAEVEPRHRKLAKHNGSAPDTDEIVQAIRRAVAEQHGLHVYDVRLLRPGSIPKTTSGKIQRNTCRSSYLKEDIISQNNILDAERPS